MAALEREKRALGGLWRGARGLAVGGVLAFSLAVGVGCKPKAQTLTPPAGTPAMEASHATYFDDGITLTPVVLVGRAPSDVVDQRLFGQRLGYADLIVIVTVEDLWQRRRGRKKAQHFLEVHLDEALLGELPKGTAETQRLEAHSIDPLPSELRGQRFLLFVRWAPAERPPFHHHLMIADDAAVEVIRAMVSHAAESGYLHKRAKKRGRRGERGKRSGREKKGEKGAG
ncbi:MAG TPA: hypothetical protein ENJ18_12515 [Nannocystis exedens]|nr:hypothetical protein [Nannocystis exedens]